MSRDKTLLHPELQSVLRQFEADCKAAGLNVLITECFRTVAEQNALYAQGRTKPGSIVTNCKGTDYQSPHQWGVAFDFCRNVKGQEYSDHDGFFKKCGAVGKKLGLAWGGDWSGFVDKPHLELAQYLPRNSTATLKKQYGTPDAFKKTWTTIREEDEDMTQAEFNKMADAYFAEKAKKEQSGWSDKEGWFKKASAAKIFDGASPQAPMAREQVAAVLGRLGLIK